jgi:hypothetical protein
MFLSQTNYLISLFYFFYLFPSKREKNLASNVAKIIEFGNTSAICLTFKDVAGKRTINNNP